jgi:hypothetical protein
MWRFGLVLTLILQIGTEAVSRKAYAQAAAPGASGLFITNLTGEPIPIQLAPGTRYPTGYLFRNGVREFDCKDTRQVTINNGGQVITWDLECGKRYAIRVDSGGQAYELVEVTSR